MFRNVIIIETQQISSAYKRTNKRHYIPCYRVSPGIYRIRSTDSTKPGVFQLGSSNIAFIRSCFIDTASEELHYCVLSAVIVWCVVIRNKLC